MEKTFYISKEQFVAVTSKWKSGNTHTVADHIIYNVLRSKPIDLGFSKKTKKKYPSNESMVRIQ
jgi:hypothetical protein